MKAWAVSNKKSSYLMGIIFWVFAAPFIAWTYKHKNMVIITILYIFINILTLMIINYYYYHENISLKQYVGIILGLIATFLLL